MIRTVLVFLAALGLSWPTASAAEDLYSISAHPTGSARFTVNKFGRNQDSDTSEDSIYEGSDLGGPIRCFADIGTTATALYISSDDPSDASDGAAPVTVTVEALDANWDPVTIVQPLGATVGATGAALTQIGSTTLMRVNRAYVSGTNPALGNIYINADNVDAGPDGIPDNRATKLVTGIVIGENQTLQACYTVPNGYNAFLTQFCTTNVNTAANASAVFRLRKSVSGAASRVQELHELAESVYQCTQHNPPVRFTEKTDIELTAVASVDNAATSGTFDLILISDSLSGL